MFGEYSNDSSHIILGRAINRKIGAIGVQYQLRLIHSQLLDFSYTAEFRPAIFESDPTESSTVTFTSPATPVLHFGPSAVIACHPATFSVSQAGNSYTSVITCGRRLSWAQGLSPVGFRVNGMPWHKLQPTFSALGGYIFSTHGIPTDQPGPTGSFNFYV